MKKLKIGALIVLNTFLLNVYSQTDELSFELTKLNDDFKKSIPTKIFNINGETIAWINEYGIGKTTSFIHKYDKDMAIIKKGKVKFNYKSNSLVNEVFTLNNKVYCLLKKTDGRVVKYLVSEVNLTNFNLEQPKEIYETEWKLNAKDDFRLVESAFVSENHLVFSCMKRDKKANVKSEFYATYNASFSRVVKLSKDDIDNKFRVPSKKKNENKGIILRFLSDNKGSLYFLMGISNDKTNKLDFSIKKINKDGKIKEFKLDFPDIHYKKITAFFQDGELFVTGNYKNNGSINSFFVVKIGENKIIKIVDHKVSAELMKKGWSEKVTKRIDKKIKKNKYDSPLYNYGVQKIIKKSNNLGYIIFLEHFGVRTISYNDGNTSQSSYFNDVLIFSVNNNREIEWENKISKSQSGNNLLSSFTIIEHEKSVSILFNDNINCYEKFIFLNLNKDAIDVNHTKFTEANNDEAHQKIQLAVVNITYDGKFKRELFFKNNESVNDFIVQEDFTFRNKNKTELIMFGGINSSILSNNKEGAEILRLKSK